MNSFLKQGRKLIAEGKLEEAVALYRQAIAQRPNFAWYYYALGATLSKKGSLDEAITAYHQAVELNSLSPLFQYHLGQALHKHGELNNALICYRKAVEINENFADAFYSLAQLKFQLDDFDKAIEYYLIALEKKPRKADVYSEMALMLRNKGLDVDKLTKCFSEKASLFAEKEQFDIAIAYYKQGLKVLPNHPYVLYYLGQIFERQSYIDTANDLYKKASSLYQLWPESKVLIILFSARNAEFSRYSFHFVKTCSAYKVKKVFFRDVQDHWYNKGLLGIAKNIDEIADHLKEIIEREKVTKVVIAGVSAGGYAALLLGYLLNVDEVHAFNPQTKIPRNQEEEERLNCIDDKKYFDLRGVLSQHPKSVKTIFNIYYDSKYQIDSFHAERMQNIAEIKIVLHSYEAGVGHSIAGWLQQQKDNMLQQIFDRAVANNPSCLESVTNSNVHKHNSNKFQEKIEYRENNNTFEVGDFIKKLADESTKVATKRDSLTASQVIEENINTTLPKIDSLEVSVIKKVFGYVELISRFTCWHQNTYMFDFNRMMKTIFSSTVHQLKANTDNEKVERAFLLFWFARNKAEYDFAIKEVTSVIPILLRVRNKNLIDNYLDVVFGLWVEKLIADQDFFALVRLISQFHRFNYSEYKNTIFIHIRMGFFSKHLATKLPINMWNKGTKILLCFWIDVNYPQEQLTNADRILFPIPYFVKNLLSKNNAKIILDCSTEGCKPEPNQLFNMMSQVTQVLRCNHSSFVCLAQNYYLPIYLKTYSKDYSQPEINILPLNSHLLYPSYASQATVTPNSVRTKKFLCFNNIVRNQRLAMLMFFYSEDLLSDSHFSFNLLPYKKQLDLDFISDLISSVTTKNININSLYKEVYSILPLRIDLDDLTNNERGQFTYQTNDELFNSSFFYISTETDFDDGTRNRRFTEKTIKPLASLNPFLVLGQSGTLKTLRNLGFQTFSDFIDESYDEVSNPVKRFQKVCQEILKLASLSYDEIESLYKQMYPILEHNKAVLNNIQDKLRAIIFDSMV